MQCCTPGPLNSKLTYEKPLNSSWLIALTTSWLIGVSVGSSLVNSASKLTGSLRPFCYFKINITKLKKIHFKNFKNIKLE